MLNNLFRINLPYGITRNEKNQWAFFNREYERLGCSHIKPVGEEKNLEYLEYKGLTNNLLEKIVDENSGAIQYDENGKVERAFFYNDATNPTMKAHTKKEKKELFAKYFEKLEKLAELTRNDEKKYHYRR